MLDLHKITTFDLRIRLQTIEIGKAQLESKIKINLKDLFFNATDLSNSEKEFIWKYFGDGLTQEKIFDKDETKCLICDKPTESLHLTENCDTIKQIYNELIITNQNLLQEEVRIDEEKKALVATAAPMKIIQDSIWNLSTQSIESLNQWWNPKLGFIKSIFAEWFYLSIVIKMMAHGEYFRWLPRMIAGAENNIEHYKKFLEIDWRVKAEAHWMQTLNWRVKNKETEWLDRFDKDKVKKKAKTYPYEPGSGGVT